MQKIVIDNNTNEVLQIINLDDDDRFDESWYPDCYIIDDINNEINTYGLVYNKEKKTFEQIEDYVEFETVVEETFTKEDIDKIKLELEATQNALNEILMNDLGGM